MTALLGITSVVLAYADQPCAARRGSVVRGRRTPIPASDKWGVKINALRHAGNRLTSWAKPCSGKPSSGRRQRARCQRRGRRGRA